MKIDLSELFDGDIEDLVEETVLDVTSKVTLDAHSNLVAASPVDTGAFRGAWELETPKKAFEDGSIENNQEYAGPLADGHSKQAPKGWVENAIEAATRL